jgi:hypothetical protein
MKEKNVKGKGVKAKKGKGVIEIRTKLNKKGMYMAEYWDLWRTK